MPEPSARVAIVDYGMGNLFSVQQACTHVGLEAMITAEASRLLTADAVILPGVGAFGDAMAELTRRDLVVPLREAVASGKPVLGICLGMQLLMSESEEFGRHQGLNIVEGTVTRLAVAAEAGARLKVPQVGWNRIARPPGASWDRSALDGLADGECLYFVHSFHAVPNDPAVILSTTRYGPTTFCSSLRRGALFACQFHPERSGPPGLRIYRNFARQVERVTLEVERV